MTGKKKKDKKSKFAQGVKELNGLRKENNKKLDEIIAALEKAGVEVDRDQQPI